MSKIEIISELDNQIKNLELLLYKLGQPIEILSETYLRSDKFKKSEMPLAIGYINKDGEDTIYRFEAYGHDPKDIKEIYRVISVAVNNLIEKKKEKIEFFKQTS